MRKITYSTAHKNLASTMERVCLEHNPVVITKNRKEAVVMLSLEDFQSLQETYYLMSNPANAKRLLESIEAAAKS